MTAKPRVALVSVDADTSHKLAAYLGTVGFDVAECSELAVPTAFWAIVMLAADDMRPDALESQVRSWLKLAKSSRVVVVTAKPAALRTLLLAHSTRLFVLAAPAFGWDVVDALRSVGPGSEPRRA